MATQEDIQPVAVPTGLPNDLKVELASIDGKNVTNGTVVDGDEVFDFDRFLDDLVHLRNLPSARSLLVGVATFVHWVLDFFLDYLLTDVVMTIAMIEAPPEVVVPAPWTDKKDDNSEQAPRVQLNHERSITASLRRTLAHLYRVGGALALCRGIAVHICTAIGIGIIAVPPYVLYEKITHRDLHHTSDMSIGHKFGDVAFTTLITFIGCLVLASMHTAWIHIVITQPTLRIWYRRLPPYLQTLRAIWLPMAYQGLTDTLVNYVLPIILKHSLGLSGRLSAADSGTFSSRNILLTLIWLLVCVLNQLACVPLDVTVTRIQASLLPEEEETIVSFDRSFGTNGSNGLRPGLLAESRGALSFRTAWQSVTWSEMRRLWILSAKILAVQACVNGSFWLIGGKNAWPAAWDPRAI